MSKIVKRPKKQKHSMVVGKPFGWDHGMKTSGKKKRVKKI